jgi:hypothetical protein
LLRENLNTKDQFLRSADKEFIDGAIINQFIEALSIYPVDPPGIDGGFHSSRG